MQRDAQSPGHATEQALVLRPNAQTRQELAEAEAERARRLQAVFSAAAFGGG